MSGPAALSPVRVAPQAKWPFQIMVKPIGPVCNLDCKYCYYLRKARMFPTDEHYRMTGEVLETFVRDYIEQQPSGTEEVNFAWQGGEPTLMGIDFFARAVELQQQYARRGMRITNAFQTNGTRLDDDWGAFLHRHKFLIGISVDGPAEIHNHYRVDKRQRDSFDQVMRGVEVLKRHQVEWNTLTVVSDHNAPHAAEVYRFLTSIGSEYLQFIPLVEPDGRGGLTSRSVPPAGWGDFLCGICDEWRRQDVGRVFVQHCELMLAVVMGQPPTLCVHSEVCGRNVAVEHNGDMFSCDHFVYSAYRLGNIATDAMADMLDSSRQEKFGTDKSNELPVPCRRCEYRRFCHGGCPKDRVVPATDGGPPHNYLCAGYEKFYRHTLPIFEAMGRCLRRRRPASRYLEEMQPATVDEVKRNDPCPCGSGRKHKQCCLRRRSS